MMPTVPNGTRTRSISKPEAVVCRSIVSPTGQGSARSCFKPSAIAAIREAFSIKRSRSCSPRLKFFRSASFAARISDSLATRASAALSSILFFSASAEKATAYAFAFAMRQVSVTVIFAPERYVFSRSPLLRAILRCDKRSAHRRSRRAFQASSKTFPTSLRAVRSCSAGSG